MKTSCLLGLCLCAPMAWAQDMPPPPSPPQCDSAEFRQFDFWAGEWEVRGTGDAAPLLGHNRIERSADGCRLLENWTSARGGSGQSLNGWDRAHRVWRQFWVGGDGVVLRLEGGLRDGAMVMAGELPDGNGGVQHQRITWTPQADGSVQQHWETSDDAGASWTTTFLGVYRRKADTATD